MFKDTRENQRSGFSPIFFFLFLLFLFFSEQKKETSRVRNVVATAEFRAGPCCSRPE